MLKITKSLLTISLVAALAIGGTMAYFSDTKTSTGNTFGSGTMDFRIARPGTSPHKIFDVSNLKPGQVVEGYFVVVNDSTEGLDMKWKAWITGFNADTYSLDRVLEVKITMNPADYDPALNPKYTIAGPVDTVMHDWTHIHDLVTGNTILAWDHKCCLSDLSDCEDGSNGKDEPFRVDWAAVYKIEVKMQTTAGNSYQDQSFTGDLNFYATQCENTL